MFKFAIVLLLLVVLASLGASLVFMVRDRGRSKRPVMALTVRIGLSVALFAMLIVGYFTGTIRPHGIYPSVPSVTPPQLPDG